MNDTARSSGCQLKLLSTLRASQAQIDAQTGNRGPTGPSTQGDPALCVRFTRDSAYLLSTTKERRLIHLWNPRSGTYISSFRGHGKQVRDVDIEHSNARFVSCGGDYDVFKWDVESGRIVSKYRGHERDVNAVRYDERNCAVFASGGSDCSVRLWDARMCACVQVLAREHFKDTVMSVDWVGGASLITGSVDGCVKEFDVRQGRVIVDDVADPVTSVYATERYLLAACMGMCWSVCDRYSLVRHESLMLTCSRFVLGHHFPGRDIKLVDRANGSLLQSFCGHKHTYSKLTALLTPDEQNVISGSEDGFICVWETLRGAESLYRIKAHEGEVTSVAAAGELVASGGVDGSVFCFRYACI